MKFGFEREFFVQNDKEEFVLAEGLPRDDCGYLAEVRGEPHHDPIKALALYLIEEERVIKQAEKLNLTLKLLAYAKLPSKFLYHTQRRYGKGPSDEGSMYGKFWNGNIQRAGLHIHFSNQEEVVTMHGKRLISGIIDMPRFIYGLDKIFEKEIKDAKRVPGLYEMKDHGFEYRSLPASVDMKKVVDALIKLRTERWSTSFFSENELVAK